MTNKDNHRKVGAFYEELAANYMREHEMIILEMNYRCKQGEIDIIAKDKEYLVIAEVKYRSSLKSGYPAEAVTAAKQRRIYKAAQYYLYSHGLPETTKIRFDVIAILKEDITYIKNAF